MPPRKNKVKYVQNKNDSNIENETNMYNVLENFLLYAMSKKRKKQDMLEELKKISEKYDELG